MNKILAVDNDELMMRFYEVLFSEAGYQIRTAPDASAGLLACNEFRPELLVLDAEMPSGGGEAVFRSARHLLGGDIPVVLITGLPGRVVDFALSQTRVRVLSKPVHGDELLSAAAGLLVKRN